MTATEPAISSILYASASFDTAKLLRRCCRIGDMTTFLPPGAPSIPSCDALDDPIPFDKLNAPSAAALIPDAARTARSEASSTSLRISVTPRKTAGSMGGGRRSSASERKLMAIGWGEGVSDLNRARSLREVALLLDSKRPRTVGRAAG
jgi:hypothetical protein